MKRIIGVVLLSMVLASMLSNAVVNVTYEPEHPKIGQKVTFHVSADNASDVRLKYCTPEACYFVNLVKQGNEWIGNFTMPDKDVDVDIIVDGIEAWNTTINAASGNESNKTPFVSAPLTIAAITAIAFAMKRIRK